MMLTHFKIWELNCSLHFKDIYLQRKSELVQIKTVWISIQIYDKPCWLSKNIWETLGYSILPIKLRPGDSSLQRPVCANELPSTLSSREEGQFIQCRGYGLGQQLYPRPAHQGFETCLRGTGLPLMPGSYPSCAGDVSQLLSARKCKRMFLCASQIHNTT